MTGSGYPSAAGGERRLRSASFRTWPDSRVEHLLRMLACTVLALIGGMVVFVFIKAWPSFSHNGLGWFGSGGNVDQQLGDIFNSPANPDAYVYHLRAWPLLYATAVTTLGAVIAGLVDIAARSDVHRRVRSRPRRAGARAGRAAARGGAVGRLRADRSARARAVRRQPPHQRRSARSRSSTSSS